MMPTTLSAFAFLSIAWMVLLPPCYSIEPALFAGKSVNLNANQSTDYAAVESEFEVDLDAADVRGFLLTGWYPLCSTDEELPPTCSGDLITSTALPQPLDPTGATCYVNPFDEYKVSVVWYSTVPAYFNSTTPDKVYAYMAVMSLEEAPIYLPTNCSFGVCECDPFEPVRSGWDDPNAQDAMDWCTDDKPALLVCSISEANLAYRDCNINAAVLVFTNRTGTEVLLSNSCVLMARLSEEPTLPPTTSGAFDMSESALYWSSVGTLAIMMMTASLWG